MKRTKGIVLSVSLALGLLLVTIGTDTDSDSSLLIPTVSQYAKGINII
jgi:hypothetical protein